MESIEKKLTHLNNGGEPPRVAPDGSKYYHPNGRTLVMTDGEWIPEDEL